MNRLLIILLLNVHLFGEDLFHVDERFEPAMNINFDNFTLMDTTVEDVGDSIEIVNFPARPLLFSLILPGLGQYVNHDPWWKPTIFVGVELLSIYSWLQWNRQAEDMRKEYEMFGDDHWSLEAWVANTHTQLTPLPDLAQYDDFILDGSHKLELELTGVLAEQYGTYVSSDLLVTHPEWIYSEDLKVLKDRQFYENIGKYDQFVGGWDDVNDWYELKKTVEDTVEILLMTPNKKNYIDQRARSNDLLRMANYAVTALMFNHVISGMEAIFSNQRKIRKKIKDKKETNIGLYYDPRNKYGIGGVRMSFYW